MMINQAEANKAAAVSPYFLFSLFTLQFFIGLPPEFLLETNIYNAEELHNRKTRQ
jgi:hypothetical protein